MRIAPPVILLYAALLGTAAADEALGLAAPKFLVGPQVSHSALGATYAYRGRPPHPASGLEITIVDVPAELAGDGGRTPGRCLAIFLAELSRGRPGFFAAPVAEPLRAGGLEFAQARWLDTADGGATGVMGCAVHGSRYVAISYRDSVKGAVDSFPKIRAALAPLQVPQ